MHDRSCVSSLQAVKYSNQEDYTENSFCGQLRRIISHNLGLGFNEIHPKDPNTIALLE